MRFSRSGAVRAMKRLAVYGTLGGCVWLTLWLGQTIYYRVPWVKTYPSCFGGFGEPHRKEIKGELDSVYEGYYVIEVGWVRKDTEDGGYFVPLWYWLDSETAWKDADTAARSTWKFIPKALRSKTLDPGLMGGPEIPQPCALLEIYALKYIDKPWLQ